MKYGFGLRDAGHQLYRRNYVRLHTHHLSGPRLFQLEDNEVVLTLLGRDIAYFAPVFLNHYRALGIEKFVYVDNGSRDGSVEFFSRQPNTIVARCNLNFRDYERELRYMATSDFARGGWRLAVDADELLDYPNHPKLSLPELVNRLQARNHTGLVAQMLEMVPPRSLSSVATLDFDRCLEEFRFYSIEQITSTDYHGPDEPLRFFSSLNTLSDTGVKLLRGGIRRTVFGEDCLLTKHVLFKDGGSVLPLPHPHFTCGIHCTDFTAVLRHYKFAGNYLERERHRKIEKRLSHEEGEMRLMVIEKNGDVDFSLYNLKKGPTPEALTQEGFTILSDQAQQMLVP